MFALRFWRFGEAGEVAADETGSRANGREAILALERQSYDVICMNELVETHTRSQPSILGIA
jgi:hypothetical protein